MRSFSVILLASLLFAFVSVTHAARESTFIELQVTYDEYVKLVGTVVGAVKTFSVDDIKPAGNRGPGPTVSVGSLGISSNLTGDCTLNFTTRNNFRLRHLVSNRRLTNYRLNFNGKRINRRRNTTMTLPCNSAPTSLDFTATGRFRRNVASGIYSDTVTIVVTTQ